jgi:hypothetical protein
MPDGVIRPAILWLHGGALIFGDRRMRDPAISNLFDQVLAFGAFFSAPVERDGRIIAASGPIKARGFGEAIAAALGE